MSPVLPGNSIVGADLGHAQATANSFGKTPLQLSRYLVRAFETGFGIGVKPIDGTIVLEGARATELSCRSQITGSDLATAIGAAEPMR